MDKNKKIIIISVAVLSIIALVAGMYFAWLKNKKPAEEVPLGNENQQNMIISPGAQSKMSILTNDAIAGFWIDQASSTEDIYYVRKDGSVFKIVDSGSAMVLSSVVQNPQEVYVPWSGPNILLRSVRGENSNFAAINASAGTVYPPHLGIDGAAISPDGKSIAAMYQYNNTAFLGIGDISTENYKKTIRLSQIDFVLQWPWESGILLVPKPSGEMTSDVWKYDIKTGKLSKFISEKGLMMSWSRFGDAGLKFFIDSSGDGKFALMNKDGGNSVDFKFITFPDKCFIASPGQLYCAIPQDQGSLADMVLPDDYLMRKTYFRDGIYQIDIGTQKITPLYEGSDPIIDAVNISVSGDKLYFINRYDNKLYRLDF